MRIGHILPVANYSHYHASGELGQLPVAVYDTGTADVAQDQGPGRRGGRGG